MKKQLTFLLLLISVCVLSADYTISNKTVVQTATEGTLSTKITPADSLSWETSKAHFSLNKFLKIKGDTAATNAYVRNRINGQYVLITSQSSLDNLYRGFGYTNANSNCYINGDKIMSVIATSEKGSPSARSFQICATILGNVYSRNYIGGWGDWIPSCQKALDSLSNYYTKQQTSKLIKDSLTANSSISFVESFSGENDSEDYPYPFDGKRMPIRTKCTVGVAPANELWLPATSNRRYVTVEPFMNGGASYLLIKTLPSHAFLDTLRETTTYEYLPTSTTSGVWVKSDQFIAENYYTKQQTSNLIKDSLASHPSVDTSILVHKANAEIITGVKEFTNGLKTNDISTKNGVKYVMATDTTTDVLNNGNSVIHVGKDGFILTTFDANTIFQTDKDGTAINNNQGSEFLRSNINQTTFTRADTLVQKITKDSILFYKPTNISLSSLTGIVPIVNGGTGSATKNFVDLTTNQTSAGLKNFTSGIKTGDNNIRIGYQAANWVPNNDTHNWVCIGNQASFNMENYGTTNTDVVTIGHQAAYANSGGQNLTAVGAYAAYNAGNMIGGTPNITAIGANAGYANSQGSNWTAIGASAGAASTTDNNETNWTAIGYNSKCKGSNTVSLGNTSCTGLYFAENKFLDNNKNATLGTITSSALTTAGIVTNTSTGVLGTTQDYGTLSTNQTFTGAKAFSNGAVFYGNSGSQPAGIGSYLTLYKSSIYGLRLLGFDGVNYRPFSLGARIGTTGAVFAEQHDSLGNVTFNGSSTKVNQLSQNIQTLTDAASVAWNGSLGANAILTLTDAVTAHAIANPTNLVAGCNYRIIIKQSANATYPGVSWGTIFAFPSGIAPVLNTNANGKTTLFFFYDGTNMNLENVIAY